MVFEKKKNLALVLSGGTARGLAHIGALEVLEENHIPIDAIVGTSMGALVGGLYAAGTLKEFTKEIKKLSESRIRALFFSRKLNRIMKNMKNLDSNKTIGPFLSKFTKGKQIEDLGICFTAVATDLRTGKEVFINKGDLLKAILASVSIPGIFHPVKFGKKILVDGGVIDPIPQKYAHLIARKAIIINAIPKKFTYESKGDSVMEVISDAAGIMSNTLANLESIISFKYFRKERFVFIQMNTEKTDSLDFSKVNELLKIGRRAAKKELKNIIELAKS